jgi:hypothetical protein
MLLPKRVFITVVFFYIRFRVPSQSFSLFLALIVRFGLHGRLASFFFFYALSQPALVLGDR